MLRVCRRNAEDRGLTPSLAQARFQDFAFETAFAALIVPASSFTLVDDFEDALAVLGGSATPWPREACCWWTCRP